MNENRIILTENQSSVATLRNVAKAREIVSAQRAAQKAELFQRIDATANSVKERV
jgi:hypothetical protein